MKAMIDIFRRGLQKTSTALSRSLRSVLAGEKAWTAETYEDFEAALIQADFGVDVARRLAADLRDRYSRGLIATGEDIRRIAAEDVRAILAQDLRPVRFNPDGPTVILLVGVNGSGKTTTAGKLAHQWRADGRKVMLAACDTFRAAAVEQLKLWGERTGCPVVAGASGADPAAVAFDAVESALARQVDVLLVDTAGRQHNRRGLMDELAKIRRVIARRLPDAPHEVWLTVDASVGGNALSQAREFAETAGVSGLVLTKLDGTGKGGMAVAIQHECRLPVLFVGLGEAPDDLQPFDPQAFADAVFAER
jgi:fused signal recognition particle receptor